MFDKVIVPEDGKKIEIKDGKLVVPDNPILGIMWGDAIGPDITRASLRIWDAAVQKVYGGNRKVAWMRLYAGEEAMAMYNDPLPPDTLKACQEFIVSIKGPLTTPVGGGFRSLNVSLRQLLDLYACVRPVRWYPGIPSPLREPHKVDIVIFRENTEDVYMGIEWPSGSPEAVKAIRFLNENLGTHISEAAGLGIKPITEFGTKRLVRKAIRYALDHGDEVRRRLAATSTALRRAAAGLPTVINHSDYHPGNLKFEGARISGLVDFDWAKVDLRAFDVGLAIWYFCTSWEGSADGRLRLGEVGAFLRGYQGRLREPAAIPPLSAAEMAALPDLIHAGSLYILYWGLRDYLSKPVDPDEYLVYLRHSINTTRWLARPENRRRLVRTLRGLTRSARSVASTRAQPAGHKPRAKRKSAPAGGKKVSRRGQHARRVEP